MKRTEIVLIIFAVLVSCGVLGFFAYKHFILDNIIDEGNMENPHPANSENKPSDGAALVYCSLSGEGEAAEDNYNYTIEKIGTYVFLTADYMNGEGIRTELNEQNFDPEVLAQLNDLVLSFDLTESNIPTGKTDSNLVDAFYNRYTLRWDDGTIVSTSVGFNDVKEFLDINVISKAESGQNSDKTPLSEIEMNVATLPIIGEAPNTDITTSQGVYVYEAYWWSGDKVSGKMDPNVDVFKSEGDYYLHIVLKPEEGYWAPLIATGDASLPLEYQYNVFVNGDTFSTVAAQEDETLELDWWGKPATNGQ